MSKHGPIWRFFFDPLVYRSDLASSKHGPLWHFLLDPLYVCRAAFAIPLVMGIILGIVAGILAGLLAALYGMLLGLSIEIPMALYALWVRYLVRKRERRDGMIDRPAPGPSIVSGTEVPEFASVPTEANDEVRTSLEGRLSYRSFALRCAILSGLISLVLNLVLAFTVMGLLYIPVGMVVALGTGPLLYLILWIYWKLGFEEIGGNRFRW